MKSSNDDNPVSNSSNINTLFSFETKFNADSVEWCPHDPLKRFFVCANYKLNEIQESSKNLQKRSGKILLFSTNPENLSLSLEQSIDTPAVLDQKWCSVQVEGYSILGVVNAESTLEIYRLNPACFKLELLTSYKQDVSEGDNELLFLSLDWSRGPSTEERLGIVCSDSKGSWYVFKFIEGKIELESTGDCHDFEAWIAAYYYWDSNIFFTGGDDGLFTKFDKRVGLEPVVKNQRHEAGVTCIHSNEDKEFIVATGSYDENLRIWDIRSMRNPLSDLGMPGPLWRLKWDPFEFRYLLSACMLEGAHIIDSKDFKNLDIVCSYYEHKSITYGADWSHLKSDCVSKYNFNGNRIIGTCSFYDNLLCVSKVDLD